ncbi:VanW family protein [Sporosarcina luteola]|uniref:VanW family protein n=1 Tax=Sporosarcina luteola TaxID=582850 RepID=UPI0020402B94|nr:VanW family protein [Sporosarcina luteola]MCM3637274.1 VanW family protein [Sporosarcina luteola]
MKKSHIIPIIIAFMLSSAFTKNTFAVDGLFNTEKFADHTYVGPFNISNNKTKLANSKLASNFSEMQSELDVNLIYQDIQFSLPPETVTFDIDMTLANANSGEDNPIIATVSREGLQTVLSQELPKIQFSENAIDSVAAGIEKELQTGIMPQNVNITDYVANEIPNKVVGTSEFTIDGISPALSKAIHALDKLTIEPFESFSMMELLTSTEVGPLSDEEMTLLSSTLYTAVLQTNFQIDERNISTVVSPNIQPGFEAAINQTLGLDFKFTNPNKTEFTIQAAWSAGAIRLSIEGKPFYYTYEPTIANTETYNPRTVVQYSAFVDDGQVVVSQGGKVGVEATVIRTLSVDGNIVETEDISKDFYAPVHRIEIHPLLEVDTSVTDSADNKETNNPQNDGTTTGTSNPEEMDSNASDSNATVSESGGEESNVGEVIYDKSGLPISGSGK